MKHILTAALFTIVCSVSAQTGNISGKITDSSGKRILPLTTVTIFKAKDTSIVTYRLSNDAGEFKIPGLPLNVPLRLMATYSGYDAFRKDFTLSASQPTFNFGSLKMAPTSKQLDEVIVVAERPPVVIKKDTIEFNASAFKTLPTALLEDLLKKMPGVEVDENGNLSFNGQKVNRILVDGKRFFGDDPKMATRNLPSNLIDKVQVVDDKEEIAQNNDGDLSKIGKVINLTLKKNIKKALFGKVFAGIGTDNRHEAGGIINTFRDTLQMSFIGFTNNINRSGFSIQDVTSLGGFNRSGFNSMSVWSGGGRDGFAINGISFGGTGNGVSTSSGGGINLNHTPSKTFSLYGQYFYGATKSDVIQQSNTQRFFGDTILLSASNTTSRITTGSHTIAAGGNWKADSLTTLNFSGNVTLATSETNALSGMSTNNNKVGAVSTINGLGNINGENNAYNYSVSYTRRFARSKNLLSIFNNLNYSRNPVDNLNELVSNYLYPSVTSVSLNQLRSNNSPNTSFNLSASYSHFISTKLTLRANLGYDYTNQAQLINVYYKHAAGGFYDSLSTDLSNNVRREQTRTRTMLTASYTVNKVTFNFGGNVLEQWINNWFVKGTGSNLHYSDLLVNAGLNWKRVNVSFSQSVSAPDINSLNPVVDNSNPFYIVYGNPLLRPNRSSNFNVNANLVNVKSSITYNIFGGMNWTDDAVIQAISLNGLGVQTSQPINVNGLHSGNLSFRMSKQFKKNPRFIVAANINLNTSFNTTPMMFNNVRSQTSSYNFSPGLRLNLNWHDKVEVNPSVGLNFRKVTYTNPAFNPTDYTGQNLQTEFIVRAPKKLVWETSVAYNYISNLAPGLPKSNVYWNAALTFLMFKEDKGQLKLAVLDILNRNNAVYRYINGNTITDNRTNVLQRYFMLTYSYNIRSLAGQKQKVGGRQNMFFF